MNSDEFELVSKALDPSPDAPVKFGGTELGAGGGALASVVFRERQRRRRDLSGRFRRPGWRAELALCRGGDAACLPVASQVGRHAHSYAGRLLPAVGTSSGPAVAHGPEENAPADASAAIVRDITGAYE
jgi:hypothetical protein